MEIFLLYVAIVAILFLVKFIFAWIKVFFFLWGAGIKKNSFKMTIAYLIGHNELKDLV